MFNQCEIWSPSPFWEGHVMWAGWASFGTEFSFDRVLSELRSRVQLVWCWTWTFTLNVIPYPLWVVYLLVVTSVAVSRVRVNSRLKLSPVTGHPWASSQVGFKFWCQIWKKVKATEILHSPLSVTRVEISFFSVIHFVAHKSGGNGGRWLLSMSRQSRAATWDCWLAWNGPELAATLEV